MHRRARGVRRAGPSQPSLNAGSDPAMKT